MSDARTVREFIEDRQMGGDTLVDDINMTAAAVCELGDYHILPSSNAVVGPEELEKGAGAASQVLLPFDEGHEVMPFDD